MAQSEIENQAQFQDEDEISLIDLAAVLLRRKWLIIGITALALLGSLAYAIGSMVLPPDKSYLPNYYKPKAIVLISDSGGGLSSMLGNAAGLAALAGVDIGGGGKSNGELAVMIAKSDTTVDELNSIYDFTTRYKIKQSVKTATRKAFLKNFAAVYDAKTGTLSMTFQDIDPVFAQQVVNSAVQILDRRYSAISTDNATTQKGILEKKLADVQTSIDKLEGKVKDFTEKHGIINVQAMATEQVTVLARLRSELIMKDMEIENYQKFSKLDDPVVQRLTTERQALASKITEIEQGGSVLPSQKDIPELSFEYAALQRDLTVQMEVFKTLTQQYELAKLQSESQGPAFQVLELAEVPDMKAGPARSTTVAVATMAGFFLSVLLAFVLNAVENIRNDPEAMKKLRGEA